MKMSLTFEELIDYVCLQCNTFFPDKSYLSRNDSLIINAVKDALDRCDYSFSRINDKFYYTNNESIFSHLHMDQYTQFLYFIANSLWKRGGTIEMCSKLSLLGRAISGCWISFKCCMPSIFLLTHPVGTVIGNKGVEYSDYMVVLQDVTINGASTIDGGLSLGKWLFMGAGSKLIGGGEIGDRVSIGANTLVRNPSVSCDSIVYRDDCTGIVTRTEAKECKAQKYFRI